MERSHESAQDHTRSVQAFCESYLLAKTKPTQEPFLDWVKIAFSDFYSRLDDQDLLAFQTSLARRTQEIANLYEASFDDEISQKNFSELCIRTCRELDTNSIWFRQAKLRAYIDVSLQVKILQILVDHLAPQIFWPSLTRLQISRMIAQHQPTSRVAFLMLGESQLADGAFQPAILSAKAALALCGSCPSAQNLLFRAYGAQETTDSNMDHSDMAMYDLSEYFCSKPFDTLATVDGGDAIVCDCGGWLPYFVGNAVTANSVDGVWNSEAAQEIRRSIHDGSFKYCSRMLCPSIVGKTLPKKSEVEDIQMRRYMDEGIVHLEEAPRNVQLSHDATCNLACPSCRPEIVVAAPEQREKYSNALERVIFPLLKRVDGKLALTGWGDPFSSPHYRAILKGLSRAEYPRLQISILTNGLLLTPAMWERCTGLQEVIFELMVSIDAASAETYENVRRPGRWKALRQNLSFISQLRKTGVIESFLINFVVQKANFREIPQFIELGLELGVDAIQMQKMWNFGHMSMETFLDMDVASPSHPLHEELLQVLSHPLLVHEKVMTLSNITGLIVEARKSEARHANT